MTWNAVGKFEELLEARTARQRSMPVRCRFWIKKVPSCEQEARMARQVPSCEQEARMARQVPSCEQEASETLNLFNWHVNDALLERVVSGFATQALKQVSQILETHAIQPLEQLKAG
jgi:hypothetical protein